MLVYLQALDSSEDRTRFERLYTAYRNLMFCVARRILRNDQDAEDAVHLAFLSLAQSEAALPAELGPKARALAATVAERKAIDLYRARKRHPEAELEDLPSEDAPPSDGTLAGAMAALPPRYREVLLLRFYNGYSAGEIGVFLGTTAENVRQIIARAKRKLAVELAERGEPV
ncbi:MAG: sigma-70 family RNA polymerase sigma factor [Oscillibacter sp.]|nr:sigma-70 family RNA polymerase sigma factor [Oscillibacter sp.]